MKGDMELVRKRLCLAEEDGKDDELCEEYGQDVVAGHVAILLDAKLVVGEVVCNEVGVPVASSAIMESGSAFLATRETTLWRVRSFSRTTKKTPRTVCRYSTRKLL